ncbi:hypothetical protein QBC45DRAFT_408782 [Copromyces sp. CBS 386.78]|nr:hypothetical protein QBC45DRAFT_408782 [Copromyces sp. CBS 386.78]
MARIPPLHYTCRLAWLVWLVPRACHSRNKRLGKGAPPAARVCGRPSLAKRQISSVFPPPETTQDHLPALPGTKTGHLHPFCWMAQMAGHH